MGQDDMTPFSDELIDMVLRGAVLVLSCLIISCHLLSHHLLSSLVVSSRLSRHCTTQREMVRTAQTRHKHDIRQA